MTAATKTEIPYLAEFRLRLGNALKSRGWASDVANGLCHAAAALRKIPDVDARFDALCDFILRGNEKLKSVDDSNASLQSVFWDGDVASQIWDATAPLVSDKDRIVRFVLLLFDKGWDRIAVRAVVDWYRLYLPKNKLEELRDALLRRADDGDGWDRMIAKGLAASVWVQCGDPEGFDRFVRKTLRLPLSDVWQERIRVLETAGRWDDAIARCSECAPEYSAPALILEIARKKGDPETLRRAYEGCSDQRIEAKMLRTAKKELPGPQFSELVRHIVGQPRPSAFLDPEYATFLLDIGDRKRLRSYVLGHAGDDVCKMRAITGYFPLGTALAKAGEPLLATIPMRLGILYLMSQSNSRYYPTVHRKMDELAALAARVADWETIQSHADFERDFAESFASRRSYW